MRSQRILPLRAAELLITAAAGGLLALGGAAALGKLGDHTTIQQVSPLGSGGFTSTTLGSGGRGLTTEEIYKRTSPGVVQITATSTVNSTNPFDIFPTQQTEEALGSGFVIDKAGHVVTNYHVIEGAQKVQVSFSQNDQIDAKVVGTDASTDLAVLQIDTHSRSLTPLPLGDSDTVQVGDPVVAIGNPFGFARTATAGIVSAVQRSIEAPNGVGIGHAIQTDAAINHGNSGGPLIDTRGAVIGVNSQISTGNTGAEGNVGIGFAVPVNTVKTVAAQLIHGGKAQHPYLGIEARPITDELVRLFNLPVERGLLVQDVKSGSGAEKAGIKAGETPVVVEGDTYQLGGDIIVGADGTPVTSEPQLRDLIARKKPGDELKLEIYRDGKKQTVDIKLGRQPPSPNG
ncbi:MAG TPA: trypsin-like peptidase domain-containing protein [Gaiellaceae bacterium]